MKLIALLLLLFLSVTSADPSARLHEVHSSSWSGDRVHQLDISTIKQAGDVLQCAVLAAKRLLSDQFLVFIAGQGAEQPQCILASRSGAVCRRLMPPTQPSPCCARVFVTSLSGCLISIQRRVDSSTSFVRSWTEYAAGFGPGPHTNHWIGLRTINSLTWPSGRQLRIRMRLWNDTEYWANYTAFSVDSEVNKFKASISGFSGSPGLGNCMHACNGMYFSTFDSDNDISPHSCSDLFHGGWWYGACHCTNPNGLFFYPPVALDTNQYAKAIVWSSPFDHYYSMKEFEMLLD